MMVSLGLRKKLVIPYVQKQSMQHVFLYHNCQSCRTREVEWVIGGVCNFYAVCCKAFITKAMCQI